MQIKNETVVYRPANEPRSFFFVQVGVLLQGRQDVYVLIKYVAVLGVFFAYVCIYPCVSLCVGVWKYAGLKNIIILWVK